MQTNIFIKSRLDLDSLTQGLTQGMISRKTQCTKEPEYLSTRYIYKGNLDLVLLGSIKLQLSYYLLDLDLDLGLAQGIEQQQIQCTKTRNKPEYVLTRCSLHEFYIHKDNLD